MNKTILILSVIFYILNIGNAQNESKHSISLEIVPLAVMQAGANGLNISYNYEARRFIHSFTLGFMYSSFHPGNELGSIMVFDTLPARYSTEVDINTNRPYPLGGVVNKIDSFCIDYDKNFESNLYQMTLGEDGLIYICGIDISFPMENKVNSWWGYFDPETSFISSKTTISKSKNVILFPNICNYGDQVFFESDNFIEEIQIVGINGTQVGKIQSNTHSGSITIPDIDYGLYLLIFKSQYSDNKLSCYFPDIKDITPQ